MKTKSDYATQLDSCSYKQLLVECRELGLSARGNKTTLRKRLIGKRVKSTQGLKSPREKVDGVDEYPTSEDEEATASRPDSNLKEKEEEEEVATASRPDRFRLNIMYRLRLQPRIKIRLLLWTSAMGMQIGKKQPETLLPGRKGPCACRSLHSFATFAFFRDFCILSRVAKEVAILSRESRKNGQLSRQPSPDRPSVAPKRATDGPFPDLPGIHNRALREYF